MVNGLVEMLSFPIYYTTKEAELKAISPNLPGGPASQENLSETAWYVCFVMIQMKTGACPSAGTTCSKNTRWSNSTVAVLSQGWKAMRPAR